MGANEVYRVGRIWKRLSHSCIQIYTQPPQVFTRRFDSLPYLTVSYIMSLTRLPSNFNKVFYPTLKFHHSTNSWSYNLKHVAFVRGTLRAAGGLGALLAVGTVAAALGGRLAATGVMIACAVVTGAHVVRGRALAAAPLGLIGWLTAIGFSRPPYAQLRRAGQGRRARGDRDRRERRGSRTAGHAVPMVRGTVHTGRHGCFYRRQPAGPCQDGGRWLYRTGSGRTAHPAGNRARAAAQPGAGHRCPAAAVRGGAGAGRRSAAHARAGGAQAAPGPSRRPAHLPGGGRWRRPWSAGSGLPW